MNYALVSAAAFAGGIIAVGTAYLNCDVQIVGSGTGFADHQWLESVGPEAAERVMGTSNFNPSFGVRIPEAAEHYAIYLREHNNIPMPLETSNGWCGMATLVEALAVAGSSDREAIADALYNMDLGSDSLPMWYVLFEGVKFNTSGDNRDRYNQNERVGITAGEILKQVLGGEWQLVWPLEYKTADIVFE